MIPLTEQQSRAVEQAREPVHLRDLRTQREYVLLQAEQYDRLRRLAEAEIVDPSLYEFEELERDG